MPPRLSAHVEDIRLNYQFHGGPFDGRRTSRFPLGEWVVLFFDEHQRPTSGEDAFAVAAYSRSMRLPLNRGVSRDMLCRTR